ncbi:hypothetical protein TNCV_4255681 [Trichonephila clavipes]|nr:hypothetical protein TNCV_4255681 [Trichonephila clavipes]
MVPQTHPSAMEVPESSSQMVITTIIPTNYTTIILYQQDPHVIDSTEGLVIFSDSKSAIEAIRNGEKHLLWNYYPSRIAAQQKKILYPAMDTRSCQH